MKENNKEIITSEKIGKNIVIGIVIGIITLHVITIAIMYHYSGNTIEANDILVKGALKIFVNLILLYFFYRWYRIAKRILVILLFLWIISWFKSGDPISLIFWLLYLGIIILCFIPPVNNFLKQQKQV